MLLGMGHLEGLNGPVLPAPSLLLCQAGGAAVPRGSRAASLRGPGGDPRLQVRDVVPARRLQVRAGGAAVPGSAPPPRQVPGPSREVLKQKSPSQNHLRAEPRRDGAGSASRPWRVSSAGLFGFEARTTTLR